jgi:hypothetical protein
MDDTTAFRDLLVQTVFASQSKYGAYGTPSDIKVKELQRSSTGAGDRSTTPSSSSFSVTFTTLTPAMRESERQVWIQVQPVYEDTLVCLVVGTTKAKFNQNIKVFESMIDTFVAVEAPPSSLRRQKTTASTTSESSVENSDRQ